MFYAVLALFLKEDINLKTSKHAGIISLFDKEFVHTGKIEKSYSKMLHKIFDARQEGDYREFAEQTTEDASQFVKIAEEFIECTKKFIERA